MQRVRGHNMPLPTVTSDTDNFSSMPNDFSFNSSLQPLLHTQLNGTMNSAIPLSTAKKDNISHVQSRVSSAGEPNRSGLSSFVVTPPTQLPPPPPPPPSLTPTDFDLSSYLYDFGFIHGAWADVFLSVGVHPAMRLHSIIVARSPTIHHYLTSLVTGPFHISIPCTDKSITPVTLSICLGSLYGQKPASPCDEVTARGLIATAALFGISDIGAWAVDCILRTVSKESLRPCLEFAMSAPAGSSPLEVDILHAGPYPPFTKPLLSHLLHFLLVNMNVGAGHQQQLDPEYREIILALPFQLYKYVIENDNLKVSTPMARHVFAREMTALREANRKANFNSTPHYEESVVLAFGAGKGQVNVIRKSASKKKLWKSTN